MVFFIRTDRPALSVLCGFLMILTVIGCSATQAGMFYTARGSPAAVDRTALDTAQVLSRQPVSRESPPLITAGRGTRKHLGMEEGVELECPVGEGCSYRTQKLEFTLAKEILMVHVEYKHKEYKAGAQDPPKATECNGPEENIIAVREDPEGAEIDSAGNEETELSKKDIEAGTHSPAQQVDLQLGCIQSMFMAMKCTAEHSAYVALLIALALAVMDGSGDYGVVAFLLKRGFPISAFLVLGTECLAAGVVIGKPVKL